MADSLVSAFVNISTLEAITSEASFTLALSPTLIVGADGTGMATPVFFLAFINVLAVGSVSNVSIEANTAVAAQGVVAAGLWVTAVQATETFINVVAQQTIALVAHATRTSEVVFYLQTLGLKGALAASCLTVLQVNN